MKRIAQDIKQNEFCKVYLLYGQEAYLRNQYKDKLIKALTTEGDTMNFSAYQGKDLPIGEIIDIAETMPFLADRRVIYIDESSLFGATGGSEELAEYIKQLPDTVCMIFSEESVDKRSKMYKAVVSSGYAACFDRLSREDISKWVLSRLRAEDKQITRQALDDFLDGAGDDMMLIKSELDKLLSYTYGREGITSSDIEAICIPRIEDKIFAMLDHMMAHRTQQALMTYSDLLKLREAPSKVLFMIERQLRMILHVKGLLGEGRAQKDIAAALGANPYAIGKIIPYARNSKTEDVVKALDLCAQTEEDSKSGRINDQIGVELLIIAISKR